MRYLVIAPHADDEIFGAGGTLLRMKSEGHEIGWILMTQMPTDMHWTTDQVRKREKEIYEVSKHFNFNFFKQLHYDSTKLKQYEFGKIVADLNEILTEFNPTDIFLPHYSDVHSDHRVTYEAGIAASKWFRCESLLRIYLYETVSETGVGSMYGHHFTPNVYVDITHQLQSKLLAQSIYASELGKFPFPRSLENVESLAKIRGSESGFLAAESFELVREFKP
jgi:LmbE family N-acetylglucosaminyl deacetylase